MELARKQRVPLDTYVALTDEREKVWAKAHPIAGRDPSVWRRDDDCRTMRFTDFGDRTSAFGWEIEVSPLEDGQDEDAHLRAVHWESHAARNGGDLLGDRDFARPLASRAQ
jgi:hypothetical protein